MSTLSNVPARKSVTETVALADDSALELLISLKAELDYFCSIPGVQSRRDRHAEVFKLLEEWFSVEGTVRHNTLGLYLYHRKRRKAEARQKAVASPDKIIEQIASAIWPAVEQHISVDNLGSIKDLKIAYRAAAKVCHPDTGGSNDLMVLLNDAYAFALEALIRTNRELTWASLSDKFESRHNGLAATVISGYHSNPLGAGAIMYDRALDNPVTRDELIAKLLFELLIDEWNLDGAIDLLVTHNRVAILLSGSGPLLVDHAQPLLNLVVLLVDRCYAVGRPDICALAIPVLRSALERARIDEYDEVEIEALRQRLDATVGGQKRRVILKHDRQREHVSRLTNQRFGAVAGRPQTGGRPSIGPAAEFASEHNTEAFCSLPFDPPDAARPADPSRIPFVRVRGRPADEYSPDQSWEYHQAFFRTRDVRLREKYKWGRLSAILHTLVFSDVELPIVVEQLELLTKTMPNGMQHFQRAADFLKKLSNEQIKERMQLLRKLHHLIVDSVHGDGPILSGYDAAGNHLTVELGAGYLKTMTGDIDRLRMAVETGSLVTAEESLEIAKAETGRIKFWREVLEPITFSIADAEKERDDEKVVRLSEILLGEFQALGQHGLEHNYWSPPDGYESLTKSLARLKRWDEVRGRLRELFAIPGEWREYCAPSRIQALQRRLERAERNCTEH